METQVVVKEKFRPKAHTGPTGFIGTIRFGIRLILDLQTASIHRHLKLFLKTVNGKLLDLGCGESPYRFLVNENNIKYYGVDIADAGKFDYQRSDITHFDGKTIPFGDNYFDGMMCTEVLEHVEDYQTLVNEVHRVLKPNAEAIVTIPWSARYHYVPYDYFRYTPSALKTMFSGFSDVTIIPRGTDITSISAKLIVLYFRNLFPQDVWRYIFSPLWLLMTPLVILAVFFGQLSLLLKAGSDLDPIGYTVLIKK